MSYRQLPAFLLLIVTLSACMPQQQPYHAASASPSIQGSYFVAADGVRLPLRIWKKASVKPRGIIIGVHGFNDYSHAFEGAGNYFSKRNMMVIAYDQRGFGASDQPGIWADRENLTRDLHDLTQLMANTYPGVPLYIMGESMGGAVTILADANYDLPVEGIVLIAPAVWGDQHLPLLYRPVLWAMAHTVPGMKLTGEGLHILASNNIPMLRAMSKDPLVLKETRVDSIYGLVHLMDGAYEAAPNTTSPALLLYGLKDEVVPSEPVMDLAERYGEKIDIKMYDEGYHMLTRDVQGEQVLNDIRNWLKTRR